jgi:hypothetical protein
MSYYLMGKNRIRKNTSPVHLHLIDHENAQLSTGETLWIIDLNDRDGQFLKRNSGTEHWCLGQFRRYECQGNGDGAFSPATIASYNLRRRDYLNWDLAQFGIHCATVDGDAGE